MSLMDLNSLIGLVERHRGAHGVHVMDIQADNTDEDIEGTLRATVPLAKKRRGAIIIAGLGCLDDEYFESSHAQRKTMKPKTVAWKALLRQYYRGEEQVYILDMGNGTGYGFIDCRARTDRLECAMVYFTELSWDIDYARLDENDVVLDVEAWAKVWR